MKLQQLCRVNIHKLCIKDPGCFSLQSLVFHFKAVLSSNSQEDRIMSAIGPVHLFWSCVFVVCVIAFQLMFFYEYGANIVLRCYV